MKKSLILTLMSAMTCSLAASSADDVYSKLKSAYKINPDAVTTQSTTDAKEIAAVKGSANQMKVIADATYAETVESNEERRVLLADYEKQTLTLSNQKTDITKTLNTTTKALVSVKSERDSALGSANAEKARIEAELAANKTQLGAVQTQINTAITNGEEPDPTLVMNAAALQRDALTLNSNLSDVDAQIAEVNSRYNGRITELEQQSAGQSDRLDEINGEIASYASAEERAAELKQLDEELALASKSRDEAVAYAEQLITQADNGLVSETDAERMDREIKNLEKQALINPLQLNPNASEREYIEFLRKKSGYTYDTRVGVISTGWGKGGSSYLRPTKRASSMMMVINAVVRDDRAVGTRLGTDFNDPKNADLATFTASGDMDKFGRVSHVTKAEADFRAGKWSSQYYMSEASAGALWRRVIFDKKTAVDLDKEVNRILAQVKDDIAKDKMGLETKGQKQEIIVNSRTALIERTTPTATQNVDELVEKNKSRALVTSGDKYDIQGRVAAIRGSNLREGTSTDLNERASKLNLTDAVGTATPTERVKDRTADVSGVKGRNLRADTQAKIDARVAALEASGELRKEERKVEFDADTVTRANNNFNRVNAGTLTFEGKTAGQVTAAGLAEAAAEEAAEAKRQAEIDALIRK